MVGSGKKQDHTFARCRRIGERPASRGWIRVKLARKHLGSGCVICEASRARRVVDGIFVAHWPHHGDGTRRRTLDICDYDGKAG